MGEHRSVQQLHADALPHPLAEEGRQSAGLSAEPRVDRARAVDPAREEPLVALVIAVGEHLGHGQWAERL